MDFPADKRLVWNTISTKFKPKKIQLLKYHHFQIWVKFIFPSALPFFGSMFRLKWTEGGFVFYSLEPKI